MFCVVRRRVTLKISSPNQLQISQHPHVYFLQDLERECSTHHVSLHFQCAGIGVLPTGMLRCDVSSSASFASHLPRSPAADATKCFHPIFGGEAPTRTHVSPEVGGRVRCFPLLAGRSTCVCSVRVWVEVKQLIVYFRVVFRGMMQIVQVMRFFGISSPQA